MSVRRWNRIDGSPSEQTAMHDQQIDTDVVDEEVDRPEFDRYASYEDDGDLVVCDRKNPAAWLKADETVAVRR